MKDSELTSHRLLRSHRSHATPQTTIEAIMWCVRERGPQALHEPPNLERLRRCNAEAITQIDDRMTKLGVEDAP
jgi:hypothetical protein